MIRFAQYFLSFFILAGFTRIAAPKSEEETITVKDFCDELTGEWRGSYSLWLRPGEPPQESEIEASFQPVAMGNYFLMTYSWKREEISHEGVFLCGGRGKDATATWGDSFHSVPNPMHCDGGLDDSGTKLVFNGSYSAGDGPDWGWRTEFTRQDSNSLLMEAYNITPDGLEALAVRAELERVGKVEN